MSLTLADAIDCKIGQHAFPIDENSAAARSASARGALKRVVIRDRGDHYTFRIRAEQIDVKFSDDRTKVVLKIAANRGKAKVPFVEVEDLFGGDN